jgi:recombination protein RecA
MAISLKNTDGTTAPLPEAPEAPAPSPLPPGFASATAPDEDDDAPTGKPDGKGGKPKKGISIPGTFTLSEIIAAATKEKGEGIIMSGANVPDMLRIPTGVFEFDLATGGGVPEGRLAIFYGPESSGKTNIAMRAAGNVQRRVGRTDKKVILVDLEGTYDRKWAANFLNVDDLVVVKPGYGEEAVDLIDAMVRGSDVGLLIVDSIAVLTAAREADKSVEVADVGTAAMLVKRLCNKLALAFSLEARKKHYPTVILLNQTRFKPGVLFGDPETMPGGQTMKFLSSLTVRLYGTNEIIKEIHPTMPAWKDTSAVIKKAKCPIVSSKFTYKMAMVQCEDVDIGDSNSWNLVANHLKAMGKLNKVKDGWLLEGNKEVWKTLVPLQEQYLCDNDFKLACQTMVIQGLSNKFLVAAKE